MTASSIYGGGARARQPTNTPVRDHPPDEPTPMARTEARSGGWLADPTVWLVGIIAVAVALIASVSVSGEVSIG